MCDAAGLLEPASATAAAPGPGTVRKKSSSTICGKSPCFCDDALGLQAGERRVVLVDALHGHAVGRGARRLGQRLPPVEVRLVEDARPVDRAQHDRLAAPSRTKPIASSGSSTATTGLIQPPIPTIP